ncbi:Ig-like domain-containing protein, partial [Edaphovirga cremea]|uniref:Ig-like domain-containing protein n=1 Tax=Edaphovirga cremea TaxID=2267246 RepID=UPI003988FD63
LEAGSSILVTLNGIDYTASINADGSWSAAVPAADVAALHAGAVIITASGTSTAGNPVGIQHGITVDLNAVAVSINAVTGDNVINALEKGSDLLLSGSSQNVEAGQTVNVQFAGHGYTATVQANGSWSVTVPSADLRTLTDGDVQVQVSVVNAAGNGASAAQGVHVDLSAPALTIDNITSDNVLNAAEVGGDLLLSGTSTAQAGQIVTVMLNGISYEAVVEGSGRWGTTVPAFDIARLAQGDLTVSASVNDQAGNTTQASRDVLVDTLAPRVTIATIAYDDIINATEHGVAQIVSGGSTRTVLGDKVSVMIDGKTYLTEVDASGNWSVGVPADVINGLADNSYTVTATITDSAGNVGSTSHQVVVNTQLPVLTINTLAQDDVINAVEKGQPLTVSGTSTQIDGAMVSVTLNGISYQAAVIGGVWTLNVPASDVAKLGEAVYTLTANTTDSNGNHGSVVHNLLVDSVNPSVVINTVTSDNILNAQEVAIAQAISGRVVGAAAGDTVTITVGSNAYTAQVGSDLSWSVNISSSDLLLLGNGSQTITASVTNVHGNVGNSSHSFVIDANLPGLRINTVSGDDVINSLEHAQPLVVTGTSEGFNLGDTINIVINGVTYHAAIAQGGNWLVQIPAEDVPDFPAGELRVVAEGTNAIGNQVANTHLATVDLNSVAISINTVATDDIINRVEKGQSLTLTGEVAGVEVGQTVTLNFGGQTFITTVLSGNTWSYTVPVAVISALGEGSLAIAASVTNQAGNSSSSSHAVIVDSMPPILSINALSTDNRLNAVEHDQPLTIAGNSNGLESGQRVTVTLNGNSYTATVGNDGSWALTVPAVDVMDLPEGPLTVAVSSSDLAGNPAAVQSNLLVDTQLPTVTIDNITADNIINAAEHGQAQVITGTSDAVGQVISVTVGGETYTTEVRIDKTWVIGVPSLVINSLGEGTNTVHATVSDLAGNSIALDHQFEVASGLPSLTINTVAMDNIINRLEQGQPLTISGTASSTLYNQQVEVRFNEQSYTAEIDSTGNWSVIVPADKLAELSDGRYQITANASDDAQNSANTAKQIAVDTQPPALTVNTIAGDDIINAQEQGAAVVLSGTYGNVESGQTIVAELNGKQYQVTTNGTGGVWSITVPAADVRALADGNHNVIVSLSDVANNTVTVTHPLGVDTISPVVVIAAITGDDIITSDEQDIGISIIGTTTAEAGQMLTVTFNGRNYVTTVNAGGTWSVDVPPSHFSGVIDGNYSVSVAVNDVAGNAGSASKEVAIFSQPPAISIDVFAGDDRVNINEHGLLQYITGTSDAIGQTVTVTLNGHDYTGQVSELGRWSVMVSSSDMLALSEGAAVISAQTTNTLGNSASTTRSIEVDLTVPVATVSIDAITTDTGLSSTDFVTADNTFTLSGHITGALGSGETAQISLDGGSTWQGLVLINGLWSLANQTALADGNYNYFVRVVDLAGNAGVVTQQTVVVDTAEPEQAITIVNYTDNVGLYQGNFTSGTSTDDTSPVINGTLGSAIPETSIVRIYSGATLLGVATVNGTAWSFDLHDLTDGRYNLTAVITDLAGNEGTPSSTFSLTVDTIAPAQTATINSFTDNVGTLQGTYLNGAATDDTLPLLNGSLSGAILPTDTVRIYQDEVFIGNAVVSGSNWTFQVPTALSDATTYKYTAVVTDVAGNLATPSAEFALSVDTTPPDQTATIVSYYDDVIEQVGEYGNNSYTNDIAPLLKGTLSAALREGEMLRIYQNGVLVGNATVDGDLNWTLQLSGLTDATYTYTAVVSDAVGNEGVRSSGFVMTVDTIAPTQGTVTVNTLLTADTTPTITGTVFGVADGNRLQVKVNGIVYNYGVDAELTIVGTVWSLKIPDSVAMNVDSALNAVYSVEARIADQAGNYFTDSTSNELTVYRDTAIIRSPSFDYMAETQPAFIIRGQPGTGEVLVVTIKDSLGNVVKVFNSNDGSMTQTEGGNWLVNSAGWGTSALVSGSYSISSAVTVADGSGGQYSTVQNFTVIEPVTKINAANTNDDSSSRVYATADGGYWMFWATGTSAIANNYNLQAQRYSQNGTAIGAVVSIASGTGQANNDYLQYIRLYDVYMKADGSFSVFYSADNNATRPYLQNYDANGTKVGTSVALSNSQTYELTPSYVNMADGSYVLLYSSGTVYNYNVYSIRYNAAGVALDSASVALTTGGSLNNGFSYTLAANQGTPTGGTTGTTTQGMSGVDVGDGKYAMIYMSSKSGSIKTDLYMKVFDFTTGQEIAGSEIRVNTQTTGYQIGSNTVALKSGGFITVWASNAASATGTSAGSMDGFDVYARRFTWDATQQKMVALDAADVLVNTTTNGVNGVAFDRLSVNMGVAALEQGGYVVVWSKFTSTSKSEVYAQSFDAAGNKLGGETLISTNSANLDTQPSVTALLDGGYVVSWDHMTTTGAYWGTLKNDVYSIIVNADGTIRGKGDNTAYATTASYLDAISGTLNGDAAVNTLDGRHGAQVMNAGAGNDYILIGNTGFSSVDGGSGFDTLVWDSAANLNFSEVSGKVTGIEAIHLGDNYANTLTLSLADVLATSDTTDVLVVQGGSTDAVTLTDGGWSVVGNQIWRGDTYQVLENLHDSNASLWVQQGISVNQGAAIQGVSMLLQGSTDTDVITMDPAYETLNIGNGGHDTLLYKLLNSESATGGNTETMVNGFTVGSFENTQDTDRIDISELLQGSGYTGSASASYVNGVATLDESAGNIGDYIKVVINGSDTQLQIDRDGSGSSYAATTVVTLSGVQTDLATLLANHQLTVL